MKGQAIGEYVNELLFECVEAENSLIEKEPDKVSRFLQGRAEAASYMKNNKEKTLDLIVKYLEVSPTIARKVYELDMKNMSVTGETNKEALQAVPESLPEMNIVNEIPTLERVYTDKFKPVKF